MKRSWDISQKLDFRADFDDLLVPFPWQQKFSKKIRLCHFSALMLQ